MITTYFSNLILDKYFGLPNLQIPAIYYMALSSTPLGSNGIGATEIGQRLTIPNNKVSFTTATTIDDGLVTLQADFISQSLTATDVNNKVFIITNNYIISDQANKNSGNTLMYGSLRSPIQLQAESQWELSPTSNNSFLLDIALDANGNDVFGKATTYMKTILINNIFGKSQTVLPPTTYKIALSSTPISEDGKGIIEPTFSEYTRILIPNNKTNWSNANNSIVQNILPFDFVRSSLPSDNVKYFALFDQNDNMCFYGDLALERVINIGTQLVLNSGAITVNLSTWNE